MAGLGDWLWLDDNWHDIASDLHVFHNVDDPVELPPQQLIDWATRLPAYQGVVAARQRAEETATNPSSLDGVRQVDPSLAGLAADPIFNSIIDFD